MSQSSLVEINFAPMRTLEYLIDPMLALPPTHFEVISGQDARRLYFDSPSAVPVYVVIGGQQGDEAKSKIALALRQLNQELEQKIGWVMAPTSTHNAGKGIHTFNLDGEPVRYTLHLCPATLDDPKIQNFIGSKTQVNPFKLRDEVELMRSKTARERLGLDYHLMVDCHANLVLPINRADDVVGVSNTMGSTVAGATSAAKNVAGKIAPIVEQALYDPTEFRRLVEKQLVEFEDRLSHDTELYDAGAFDRKTLGKLLESEGLLHKRLQVLKDKLSVDEITFFTADDPAGYLLTQFQQIFASKLFSIGDTQRTIDYLVTKGVPGIIECVQSTLLSNAVKYSNNRTASNTDGSGSIGDAGLSHPSIQYHRILAMKFGNTAVGGTAPTMSGFMSQDALSKIGFEKTATLDEYLSGEQIAEAFTQVTAAFYKAFEKGYSLRDSKVRLAGINQEFSLVEARALLTARMWGETGETSKRARICRLQDMVQDGVVYGHEGKGAVIAYNAGDRAATQPDVGIITGYKVVGEYPGYSKGDTIRPGMPLRQEHLTVKGCIPIVRLVPSWPGIMEDGTNNPVEGGRLHPEFGSYLDTIAQGHRLAMVSYGPKDNQVVFVRKVA